VQCFLIRRAALDTKDFLRPSIVYVWAVNRLETSATLRDFAVQVSCNPVHCANHLIRLANYLSYDADVQDANARGTLPHHSFDCDAIARPHLSSAFRLFSVLPAEHPITTGDKFRVLVIMATPCSTNNPVLRM